MTKIVQQMGRGGGFEISDIPGGGVSSIYMSASYEELGKSWKK